MLVSHQKKFIYTKTVKTAGTSVEVYFEKYCLKDGEWFFSHAREEYQSETGIIGFRGTMKNRISDPPIWYNHIPAFKIKDYLGDTIWDDYFKFCVIRNPFEKVLSFFFHLVVDRNVLPDYPSLIISFRDWIKSNNGNIAIDRGAYMIDGSICLDFFIRQESLMEDVNKVCQIIGVPFEPELFPRLKTGFRPQMASIENFYDKETENLIRKSFAFEFEYFNFKTSIFD